jgi:hypothetical protein
MGFSDTESDVLSACLEYLRYRGIFCWRNNAGAIPTKAGGFRKFVGAKGAADILGVLPVRVPVGGDAVTVGVLLAVEVKKPGGRLRPEQRAFLNAIGDRGGFSCVVTSVAELEDDLASFLAALSGGTGGSDVLRLPGRDEKADVAA